MKRIFELRIVCPIFAIALWLLLALLLPLYAEAAPSQQSDPEPDLVVSWSGSGGQDYALYRPPASGLTLQLTGITWWDTTENPIYSCPLPGGENTDDGATIKIKAGAEAATSTVEHQNCEALTDSRVANVVRDGSTLYYFVDGRLSRKASYLGSEVPATTLANAPALTPEAQSYNPSAVIALDRVGRLIWADRVGNENRFYRMKADDSEPVSHLFNHPNVGEVAKLKATSYFVNGFHLSVFVWLTDDGDLYRYQPTNSGDKVVKVADNVRDFTIHEYQEGNKRRAIILAVRGQTPVNHFSHSGELWQIDPATLNTVVLWPEPGNQSQNQLISVAVDSGRLNADDRNVYISEKVYSCTNAECTLQPGARIYRRRLLPGSGSGSCISMFCLLLEEEDGGVRLESDDTWFYFMRPRRSSADGAEPSKLYRYPTDAPPIERDLAATWLEVNQTIQNLNNDFPLVAGHATIVRGYAELELDSTEVNKHVIGARLTGVRDGKPLPETLLPIQDVEIRKGETLITTRATLAKTFVFELPEHWVENKHGDFAGVADPSILELKMVINPNQAIVETNTLNNEVKATVEIVQRETTCLAAVPLLTKAPLPNMWQLPWALLRDRTLRFLPVSDIKFFNYHTSWWIDEKFQDTDFVLSDDGDPYHMEGYTWVSGDGTDGGARDDLEWLALLSTPPCPGSTHWFGVVHPDTNMDGYGGWGRTLGSVFLGKLFYDGRGDRTVAHELMHNFGRRHTQCGVFPESQQNFDLVGRGIGVANGQALDYDPCNLGPPFLILPETYVGLDTFAKAVKAPEDFTDLMAYSGSSVEWVSVLNWAWLLQNSQLFPPLGSAHSARIAASEYLLVQGQIGPDPMSGAIVRMAQLPAEAVPGEHLVEQTAGNADQFSESHEIRLLNSAGATVHASAVMTRTAENHTSVDQSHTFIQYLPSDVMVARVQLVAEGQVIAEAAASANAPEVTLNGLDHDARAAVIDLTWSASDADGDPLNATVLYSRDDGASWRALNHGLPRSGSVRLGTNNLPGSDRARLRVLVNDGFHTGMATSDPFAVDVHPPEPIMDGLVEGERLPFGQQRTVHGIALDPEEGSLNDDELQWRLVGPVDQSASGGSFALFDLLPGDYALTLQATDSDGLAGESGIRFSVGPVVVPDGETPILDGLCGDSGYATAARVRLPRSRRTIDEGRWPQVQFFHADGALHVCFTDQGYEEGSERRVVGVQIDADGSGGDSASAGDRGFFVDEEGVAIQTAPFFGSMAPTPLPASGYDAVIAPSAVGWSAELRIKEPLVGGWDHRARLVIKHEVTDLFDDGQNWPLAAVHSEPDSWAAAYFGTPPGLPNQPPVADAGTDVQITVSKPITSWLSGGLSYDLDGDRLTYHWRQTGGPAVTLADPDQKNVPFMVTPVDKVTDLVFELTVNDGKVDSAPDQFIQRLLPTKPDIAPPNKHEIFLPLVER